MSVFNPLCKQHVIDGATIVDNTRFGSMPVKAKY
jgi:hypothetical protein